MARLAATAAVLAAALLALASESLAVTPAQRTWDLAADFRGPGSQLNPSPDSYGNPNVWQYGSEPANAPGTGFSLLGTFTNLPGFYGIDAWNNGLYELIGRQFGAATACNPARVTCSVANGDVLAHPDHGRNVIARWTSPTAGTIRIAGSVLDSDQFGNDLIWRLRGPSGLLASGAINAPDGGAEDLATFDVQGVSVPVGGVIDLVIDGNGEFSSDTAEIAMTITRPFSNCNIANAITDGGTGDTNPATGVITGGPGDDTLVGGPGAETLNGAGGADELCGGGGADTLNGGAGVDGLDGGTGADILDGGADDDTLRGGSGDASTDRLTGGLGADIFDDVSDPGIDRVLYNDKSAATTITIGAGADDGTAGEGDSVSAEVESVTGGSGVDTITGGSANNTFAGENGNDVLSGADGIDFLAGGLGADTFNGGNGSDRVTYRTAGTGYDTTGGVTVTEDGVANDGVGGGAEGDNVADDIELVHGSDGPDTINLSGFDPVPPAGVSIFGYGGNDTLTGTAGNDFFDGGSGTDSANCVGGTDTLTAIETPNVNCAGDT